MSEKQTPQQSPIAWFEIPASDFDRAARFYEHILQVTLKKEQMGPQKLGVLPYQAPATGGCVFAGPNLSPGNNGTVIYLNAGASLAAVVDRVATAGGQVLFPRVELPPGMGVFAHILDTEGNRVGLHASA